MKIEKKLKEINYHFQSALWRMPKFFGTTFDWQVYDWTADCYLLLTFFQTLDTFFEMKIFRPRIDFAELSSQGSWSRHVCSVYVIIFL